MGFTGIFGIAAVAYMLPFLLICSCLCFCFYPLIKAWFKVGKAVFTNVNDDKEEFSNTCNDPSKMKFH